MEDALLERVLHCRLVAAVAKLDRQHIGARLELPHRDQQRCTAAPGARWNAGA
jgi:hypothetical protein